MNNIEANQGELKGDILKNRMDRENCGEIILDSVWQYQNQNDMWFAFLNSLFSIKYVDGSGSEYETDEKEQAVNDVQD